METFDEYPGTKTYRAADGHMYSVDPQWLSRINEWTYIYAFAYHDDTCICESYNVGEYAGEEE